MATATKAKELLNSHPAINDTDRRDVAKHLQDVLVDLVDLSLIGKQLHWNVTGPHFRELHLQLDVFIDAWRLAADKVAERSSALGISPDGRAATVAGKSHVEQVPAGPVKDVEVIDAVAGSLAATIASLADHITATEELDPVTQDLLIEVSAGLEENHWMMAVQQQ